MKLARSHVLPHVEALSVPAGNVTSRIRVIVPAAM